MSLQNDLYLLNAYFNFMKFHLIILLIPLLYLDSIAQNSASSFVFDFETNKTIPNWSGFGIEYELGENPQIEGINNSLLTGRIQKSEGKTWDWAAIVIDLPFNVDFSQYQIMSLKVLATTCKGSVNFRLENSKKEFLSTELMTPVTKLNEWEQLVFDFKDVDVSYQYDRLTIFVDYGSAESHTYYIDDICLGVY